MAEDVVGGRDVKEEVGQRREEKVGLALDDALAAARPELDVSILRAVDGARIDAADEIEGPCNARLQFVDRRLGVFEARRIDFREAGGRSL